MAAAIKGINEIVANYDFYLIDVWGVLYAEGIGVIPGVEDVLRHLQGAGKVVIFISNAARSGKDLSLFLANEGLHPTLYLSIVTSGDCTREHLVSLGKKTCYLAGRPHNRALFKGLSINFAEIPEGADVFVACAPEIDSTTLAPFVPLLERCLKARLPMVCANPDEYTLVSGQKMVRTGLFAKYYAEHGGDVLVFGKPHKPIFEKALAFLPSPPDKARILVVGDGLQTDILGAQNIGVDSLWISSGVSSGADTAGIFPTYIATYFSL